MIIIKEDHWCPNCRVMQTDWRVLDTTAKSTLRRGDSWPDTDTPLALYDKCDGCGKDVHGQAMIAKEVKTENVEGVEKTSERIVLTGVRELGFAD